MSFASEGVQMRLFFVPKTQRIKRSPWQKRAVAAALPLPGTPGKRWFAPRAPAAAARTTPAQASRLCRQRGVGTTVSVPCFSVLAQMQHLNLTQSLPVAAPGAETASALQQSLTFIKDKSSFFLGK